MGHEALAAISIQMQEDDYIVPFYRDRALVLGRGVSSRQLAIDYFAKAKRQSAGDRCRRITAAQKNTSGVCRLRPVHNFCRRAG